MYVHVWKENDGTTKVMITMKNKIIILFTQWHKLTGKKNSNLQSPNGQRIGTPDQVHLFSQEYKLVLGTVRETQWNARGVGVGTCDGLAPIQVEW